MSVSEPAQNLGHSVFLPDIKSVHAHSFKGMTATLSRVSTSVLAKFEKYRERITALSQALAKSETENRRLRYELAVSQQHAENLAASYNAIKTHYDDYHTRMIDLVRTVENQYPDVVPAGQRSDALFLNLEAGFVLGRTPPAPTTRFDEFRSQLEPFFAHDNRSHQQVSAR